MKDDEVKLLFSYRVSPELNSGKIFYGVWITTTFDGPSPILLDYFEDKQEAIAFAKEQRNKDIQEEKKYLAEASAKKGKIKLFFNSLFSR